MGSVHRLASAALLLAACAHDPVVTPAPTGIERPQYPAPPALPRARLLELLPDPSAPPPPRAWWQVALGWITGGSFGGGGRLELVRPFGLAVALDGAIAVADPDAGRIYRIDAKGRLTPIPCPEAPEGSAPMAVTALPDGTLLVADAGGAALLRIGKDGCAVLARGAFERPTAIAVAGHRLYVADPPRHQVVVLDLEGAVLARWGEQGEGPGQLAFPTSLAVTADGSLVVTDALNFRVARFGADGRWLGAFGSAGDAGHLFSRPKGIAVGPGGRIYVSDAQRDVVLVFSSDGDPEYTLGEPGEAPGSFALPSGLAIAQDRLYVADSQNRRIQVFELLGGTP
jgi:DNA-binding beta-propeller fold protein YncE